MRESGAQVLAIDSGSSVAGERRIEAERAAELAERERRALERRGRTWIPGRRRQLDQARRHEAAVAVALDEAKRIEIELQHGVRLFMTDQELDARRDALRARLAERATERILGRSRAFGREL
jgi:hypothetical protein